MPCCSMQRRSPMPEQQPALLLTCNAGRDQLRPFQPRGGVAQRLQEELSPASPPHVPSSPRQRPPTQSPSPRRSATLASSPVLPPSWDEPSCTPALGPPLRPPSVTVVHPGADPASAASSASRGSPRQEPGTGRVGCCRGKLPLAGTTWTSEPNYELPAAGGANATGALFCLGWRAWGKQVSGCRGSASGQGQWLQGQCQFCLGL